MNRKLALKLLDFVRGQGKIRFKSGAYTVVREHFESDFNKGLGQKMMVLKSLLPVCFADA
jgi:hypothetical protein